MAAQKIRYDVAGILSGVVGFDSMSQHERLQRVSYF